MWQTFLNVLFPRSCMGCREQGTYCCAACLATMENFRAPLIGPPASPKIFSAKVYARSSLIARIIHSYKYDGVYDIAPFLGGLIANVLSEANLLQEKPVLVPVPLHSQRLRERGFNQSALLASHVAKACSLEVSEILIRHRATLPQMELSEHARLMNVKGAFSMRTGGAINPDRPYLLIDDVCTTAATLRECAQVLEERGAQQISAAVIARTPARCSILSV